MSFTTYKSVGTSSSSQMLPPGVTEFDILKSKHQFLRDEDDPNADAEVEVREGESSSSNNVRNRSGSWEDQLAKKYYDSLYREFAVCDLKHYKSGNFALRWRTEGEVLDGTGEETCGNTRCEHHYPGRDDSPQTLASRLNTVELPFAYEEHGTRKEALVKVVLCDACLRKLMYKRRRHGLTKKTSTREKEKHK